MLITFPYFINEPVYDARADIFIININMKIEMSPLDVC